jgi:hypothetical protein
MPSKRHRAWPGFALFAVLAIAALFVLHGVAAGAASLAAILVFGAACAYALRAEDPTAAAPSRRTGLRGWLGGWF